MMRRTAARVAVAGLLASLLAGCGFRPLYMPEGGRGSPAAAELAAVYIPVLAERQGQLLRQALQQRMEGTGTGAAKRYELITAPSFSGEGIAIQTDTSTTRIRLNGSASWTLRRLDPGRTVLAQGSSRITDGYNIINQQYFAADLESEAAFKRIAESLADQIVTDVAIFLKRQASTPPA